jgi:predicted Mrr-cat superfamily restriction endonuclease
MKISKRIASRLYHSTQEYVEKKKIKSGYINPDNPDCEIYNSDKLNWTEDMIDAAVKLYQKEGSLKRVKEIMSKDPYGYS